MKLKKKTFTFQSHSMEWTEPGCWQWVARSKYGFKGGKKFQNHFIVEDIWGKETVRSTELWKKDFCKILCIGRLSGVGLRQTQWLQVLGSMNLESFICMRLWLVKKVLLGVGQTEGKSHQINMAYLLVHQLTSWQVIKA